MLAKMTAAAAMAFVLFGSGLLLSEGPIEPAKVDGERIAKMIAQLGSESFNEREEAGKALEAIGRPALEALRKAAGAGSPDLETRRRAEKLVERIVERLGYEGIKIEIVRILYLALPGDAGEPRKTPPGFGVQAKVENQTDLKLPLPKPTLKAGKVTFQPSVWDGGRGWDGILGPGEKKTLSFHGTWDGKANAGETLELKIIWGPMVIQRKVVVQEREHFPSGNARCTCGCTRSEAMVAELRQQGGEAALAVIDKSLAEIAARAKAGEATEMMMAHRLRLLKVAEEIRENASSGR